MALHSSTRGEFALGVLVTHLTRGRSPTGAQVVLPSLSAVFLTHFQLLLC
jgi:hypothetical protein